ncbi:MAG: putative glutamine amidotransferase [Planctomycetota bacterium]|jgi:putative glutamine amidotransferase
MPISASSTLPLIGINGLLDPGETPRLNLPLRYADSILKAGGIPVAIPPVGGPLDLARLFEHLDGLLLSGGDDFDTERIGLGPTHPSATITPTAKQDWDFELAKLALERKLPVLGICYGMQLLALGTGGDLYQHLPEDRPDCTGHSSGEPQPITIESKTKLASLLGIQAVDAVCRHHQALCQVGEDWNITAHSSAGTIEAIEHKTHPFAMGVQWHPELSYEGSPHDGLFRGLVGAAAMSRMRQTATPPLVSH